MNATTDFEAIYITQAAIRDFEYKQVWREETKSARPRRSLETVLRRFGGYTRAPVPVTERPGRTPRPRVLAFSWRAATEQ